MSRAIRLGTAISPLKVSEMSQSSPRFMVAPTMETKEYTTRNGRTNFSPPRNSIQREPYKPHPMMVLNAKQHMAIAVRMDTQPP